MRRFIVAATGKEKKIHLSVGEKRYIKDNPTLLSAVKANKLSASDRKWIAKAIAGPTPSGLEYEFIPEGPFGRMTRVE